MDAWVWMMVETPRRRIRLAVKAFLIGGLLLMAGIGLANAQVRPDPCSTMTANFTPISISSATTTRIIAPAIAKRTYVCSMMLWTSVADNVGIVEGTGGTCGTGTLGVIGGTTAATGLVMAAQNAFIVANTGHAHFGTAGSEVDFCIITSTASQLAGYVSWVQAP